MDKKLLNSLKDGAVLINTDRVELINEEAVVEVLHSRYIYAVLDVFDCEPLPFDSPLRTVTMLCLCIMRRGQQRIGEFM